MRAEGPQKLVRSYRLVFRRRWRIFRVQGWRIPLPGGLELRALGYWLCCLATIGLIGELPAVGPALGAVPPSLRLVALPVLAAWALSRWEVDGRSPHRALLGLAAWRLRPRAVAALRRCPDEGTVAPPPAPLTMAPDLRAAGYPRGRLTGPARVALRYPVAVEPLGARRGAASARRWRLRAAGTEPLHRARVLEIPAGREVSFE